MNGYEMANNGEHAQITARDGALSHLSGKSLMKYKMKRVIVLLSDNMYLMIEQRPGGRESMSGKR